MADIPFTDEQQAAIQANGKVLVSASAGSGKTAVLVERIAERIIDEKNKVGADRFLIVTFTNAAAAEMRERIAKRLDEITAKNPSDIWLSHQKFLLSKSKISTIDSFCIDLVRQNFYLIGISADFKIADSIKLKDLQREVLSGLMNERLGENSTDFAKLCSIFESESAINGIMDLIYKISDYLFSLPFYEKYLDKCEQMYDDFDINNSVWTDIICEDCLTKAKPVVDMFEAEMPIYHTSELNGEYDDKFLDRYGKIKNIYELLKTRKWTDIRNAVQSYKKKNLNKSDEFTDIDYLVKIQNICRAADTLVKTLKSAFSVGEDEICEDIDNLKGIVKTLIETVREYMKRLSDEKQRQNMFGFSDLEQMAFRLLYDGQGNVSELAKELSDRYYEVMVDEFQDSNDLQCAIFDAVSDGGRKLFVVGDVKQSIYGFRKANPKIFMRRKNELPLYDKENQNSDCKVIMSGNFRSHKNICEFVNFVFSQVMSERAGQMRYEKGDELVAHDIDEKENANVTLDIIDCSSKSELCDDAECRYIVKCVKDTVGKVYVGKGDKRRLANYSDIAVITRKKDMVVSALDALRLAGIPCISSKNSKFFDCREISVALSLLTVVDNPKNNFTMLKLLTSEIFGFTAEDLAQMTANARKYDLYTILIQRAKQAKNSDNADECDKKCAHALEIIGRFRVYNSQMNLVELLPKIFDESGLFNISRALGSKRAAANIYKLIDFAADYEQQSSAGLSGFLRYIARAQEDGETESATVQSNENAVSVMTMHSSKGLQFPVCIVCGLGGDFTRKKDNDERIIQSEKCGITLKVVDTQHGVKYKTMPFSAAEIEEATQTRSEMIRLLYVALTRAKERLIMCGKLSKLTDSRKFIKNSLGSASLDGTVYEAAAGSKTFLELLCLALANHPQEKTNLEIFADGGDYENSIENKNFALRFINADDIPEITADEEFFSDEYDENALEGLKKRLEYEYPYQKVNAVAAKQSASRIAHENEHADYGCKAVPLFLQNAKLTAAQKGTAMHKAMQYIDIAAAKLNADAELERIGKLGVLSEDELCSIDKSAIRKFANSRIASRIAASNNVHREYEFMAELAAKDLDSTLGSEFDGEKIVVQGAVDCVFLDGKNMVIVDYKTDKVKSADELIEKYAVQLKVYEKAMRQIFNPDSVELVIYSFTLGTEISVE